LYPHPDTHYEKELVQLIKARADKLCRLYKKDKVVGWDTAQKARLPSGFYTTYSKIFKPRTYPFNMNSFLSIGLEDPFPKEHTYNKAKGQLPEEVKDSRDSIPYVYP